MRRVRRGGAAAGRWCGQRLWPERSWRAILRPRANTTRLSKQGGQQQREWQNPLGLNTLLRELRLAARSTAARSAQHSSSGWRTTAAAAASAPRLRAAFASALRPRLASSTAARLRTAPSSAANLRAASSTTARLRPATASAVDSRLRSSSQLRRARQVWAQALRPPPSRCAA